MRALYPLLFLSGGGALMGQVVWSRMLHRLLGSSSLSASIVLASFLGGMGVGALLAERRLVGRKRPLLLFAVLEASAAVLTVLGTTLLVVAPGVFRAGGGEIFAALLLVVVSAPLGASFPVLLSALDEDDDLSTRVRRLYGVNALGAGLGAVVCGLVVVPGFGEMAAITIAAGLQLVVAAGVAATARRWTELPTQTRTESGSKTDSDSLRHGASFVFLSGFVVFFWEILWMRVLLLTVGSSVYAFATVAASVVLGIGVGSLVFGGRILARRGAWVLPLAVLVLLLFAYVAVPELPRGFLFGVRSFGLDPLACGALGAGLIAFAPNFLLGCLFPWFLSTRVHVAGSLYAINSVGAILGALAAAPLTAGVLTLEGTYRLGIAAVALLLASGIALSRRQRSGDAPSGLRTMAGVFAVLVIAATLLDCVLVARGKSSFTWGYRQLLSGVYQWPLDRLKEGSLDESYAGRQIVEVIEGGEVIVSAELDRVGNRVDIKGNGKVEGSVPIDRRKATTAGMPTQLLLGATGGSLGRIAPEAPCLLIGFGSGVTLGSLSETRSRCRLVTPIDVVEIEKAFVDLVERDGVAQYVKPWFDREKLAAPVRWHFGDARRVLARELARERYSVIVSQPSEPWIVGAAPLFTVEFFREAAEHLVPGGVFVQWVQLYRVETEDLRLLVRTFRAVFPSVFVLRPPASGEIILLGSEEPLDLGRLVSTPPLGGDRQSAMRMTPPLDWLTIYIAGPEGVSGWTGDGADARLNTDRRGELEFLAPRALDLDNDQARVNIDVLRRIGGTDPVSRYFEEKGADPQKRRQLLQRLSRRNIVFGDLPEAEALLDGDDSPQAAAIRANIEAVRGAVESGANAR